MNRFDQAVIIKLFALFGQFEWWKWFVPNFANGYGWRRWWKACLFNKDILIFLHLWNNYWRDIQWQRLMVDKRICTKVNNIGTFAFKYVFSPNDLVNQSILKPGPLKYKAFDFESCNL